ncbi:hypothetical protein ScPMuIL_016721 [Solemya velum]
MYSGTKYQNWIPSLYLIIVVQCVACAFGVDTSDGYVCPRWCMCTVGSAQTLEVICVGNNFTHIPSNISDSTTLLDLSLNSLSALPDKAFIRLTLLVELRLVSNAIKELPADVFQGLSRLQILYLEGNNLTEVPSTAMRHLPSLQKLQLNDNQITSVPDDSFRGMADLKEIHLDMNKLDEIPVKALHQATSLEAINLNLNQILSIPNYAFQNSTKLGILLCGQNRISLIEDYAFEGLPYLRILELQKNRLKYLPHALFTLTDLEELFIDDNQISYIPDNAFKGNKNLRILELNGNPIASAGRYAFRGLSKLEKLILSEAHDLTEFPDLTGTSSLTELRLDRASIRVIPSDLCKDLHKLTSLDVHSNKISQLPNFSDCSQLKLLNLGNNEITSLENSPFSGLGHLKDLTLQHNYITHIPRDAFTGLSKLQYLDMAFNKIRHIDDKGFVPISNLKDLNLGENYFSKLPTEGLQKLERLKTFHNKALHNPPPANAFPKIQRLVLSYAYHCCYYIEDSEPTPNVVPYLQEEIFWLGGGKNPATADWINDTSFWKRLQNMSLEDEYAETLYSQFGTDYIYYTLPDTLSPAYEAYTNSFLPMFDAQDIVIPDPPVDCKPLPGPFMPCDDLFGWWSLRCGVWVVFMLALLGNGVVLFVSVTSRSKMDVPRFLICNLACADFFMGIYLGFLAIVDASTLGEFKRYAIRWQVSPGCLIAGFLGVLSSELSVFTLAVITLERFYAIAHAMQLNKRLSLKHAGIIMTCGWVYSIAVASLPLFEISDYRKFAICLPFETGDNVSLGYVCFIMLFNAVSFLVILICYLKMYLSIHGSQAWNSNDTRIAMRMALLVFTDFLCWAPIIFLSVTAAFGKKLVHLNEAKILTIFVLPLNSCANPFLYAIFTKQFKKDCIKLCKRLEESSISRNLSQLGFRRVSNSYGNNAVWRPQAVSTFRCEKRGSNCSNGSKSGSNCGLNYDPGHPASGNHKHTFNRHEKLLHPNGRKLRERRPHRSDACCCCGRPSSSSDQKDCNNAANFDFSNQKVKRLSVGTVDVDHHMVLLHMDNSGNKLTKSKNSPHVVRPKKRGINRIETMETDIRNDYNEMNEQQDSLLKNEKECVIIQDPLPKACKLRKSSLDVCTRKSNITGSKYKIAKSSSLDNFSSVHFFGSTVRTKADNRWDSVFHSTCGKNESSCTSKAKIGQKAKDSEEVNSRIPTQDMNLSELPQITNKEDKKHHINEWRKTSHLSFFWQSAEELETMLPHYKANSLVELTRPPRDICPDSKKRHSLTSKHEGYVLLKSNNRDSAYDEEDNDMFDFRECRAINIRREENRKMHIFRPKSANNNSLDSHTSEHDSGEASSEQTGLLCPEICGKDMVKRGSYDRESGFSSEN